VINPTAWLPDLICFDEYGGDWNRYLDALYAIFKRDFIESRPTFPGYRVGLKKHPMEQGKEATFWHFISEGSVERERLPDLRRCERIAWPRAIIEAVGTERVRCWRNDRKNERRILLVLPDFTYAVILADRGEYVLPWTAYVVKEDRQRRRLQKEYDADRAEQKC
jgi:hypothetical protein